MTELTRGQRAAQTRARNKAAREAEAVAATQQGSNGGTPIPFPKVQQFLASIADIEKVVFGDVQDGTVITTLIDSHSLAAYYDGKTWHLVI